MNNNNNARRRRNNEGEEIVEQPSRSFMNRIRTVKNSALRFAESIEDLTVGQIRDYFNDPTPLTMSSGTYRALVLMGFTYGAIAVARSHNQAVFIANLTKKLAEAQRGAPQLAPATFKLMTNMLKKGGRRTMKKDCRRNSK